jgi:hypothetical protein
MCCFEQLCLRSCIFGEFCSFLALASNFNINFLALVLISSISFTPSNSLLITTLIKTASCLSLCVALCSNKSVLNWTRECQLHLHKTFLICDIEGNEVLKIVIANPRSQNSNLTSFFS